MKLFTSKKVDVSNGCPKCGAELDGENHLECTECEYWVHELDILDN